MENTHPQKIGTGKHIPEKLVLKGKKKIGNRICSFHSCCWKLRKCYSQQLTYSVFLG